MVIVFYRALFRTFSNNYSSLTLLSKLPKFGNHRIFTVLYFFLYFLKSQYLSVFVKKDVRAKIPINKQRKASSYIGCRVPADVFKKDIVFIGTL